MPQVIYKIVAEIGVVARAERLVLERLLGENEIRSSCEAIADGGNAAAP